MSERNPPRPRGIPLLTALATASGGRLSIADLAAHAAPDIDPPIDGIRQCTKALHRLAAHRWVRQAGYSRSDALRWMYRWEITPAGRDHLATLQNTPPPFLPAVSTG